jgi:hypothetical protein
MGRSRLLLSDGSDLLLHSSGPTPSTDPNFTSAYFYVRNALREVVEGATFTFTLADVITLTDAWGSDVVQSATSDEDGLVEIQLMVDTKWKMIGPDGHWIVFTTNKAPLFPVPYYKDSTF